jgi:hypothetical protein
MERLVSLNQDATGITKILQSATPANENELGGAVIKCVAIALPLSEVAAAGCDVAMKVRLALANSKLLSLAPFWPDTEDDRLIIMRELRSHDIDLDEAVSGALPKIGERETIWLLQQGGARAAAAILRGIVRLSDSSGFPMTRVFRVLMQFPDALREGLTDGDFHLDKAAIPWQNRAVIQERLQCPPQNSTTPPFRMTI